MAKNIRKILLANRSEIALRVIRTCESMGIETVAIYADDDKDSLHVSSATEAICLGTGDLKDTYLNQDKIIDIAKQTNCDAIHPGYGFLSENASFCEAVEKLGLIFIGPTSDSIKIMGDKKQSKVTVGDSGGPLIPGYHGDDQTEKVLKDAAEKIGVPVLIKASAGGGGKGMRIIRDLKDFSNELASAKSEAMNAFGNDIVLIEKYIENPRHIEVQVMSDVHGNHLHFYERECSIQRRHQKIIEETPSPALNEELRNKICDSAVQIAKSINYRGAGTVEYILAPNGEFYFLEMNTRLQVEHPITEMVTGVDLVKLQIIVAQGDELPMKQEYIHQSGHAFEVRVYAEDPDQNFMPTGGTIGKIGSTLMSGVRVETAYKDGDSVTMNYDPMVAKLVAHDIDRVSATKKVSLLMQQVPFLGLHSNLDYIQRILHHDKFISGETFTNFVETYSSDLGLKEDCENAKALAIAAEILLSGKSDTMTTSTNNKPMSLFSDIAGFRN